MVAHLVWDQGVAGSNPVTPTNFKGQGAAVTVVEPGENNINRSSGCSAVGSASGLGPGGRRFESCHPDSNLSRKNLGRFFFVGVGGG